MRKQKRRLDPVESDLNDAMALSVNDRKAFIQFLRLEYAKRGTSHYCDTLQCNVTTPCRLGSCAFNFDNDQSLNCMLHHKSLLDDSVKIPDAAEMFGKADRDIKKRLDSVFNKIRAEMLRQTLKSERVNTFDYVYGTKVCVNCGNLCSSREHAVEKLDLRWCSRSCKLAKPQWCIDLEAKYRTDIRTLLFHAQKMFKHLVIIASLFHIRKTTLLELYFEYFGIKPSKFGFEAVDNVDILRNPKESWEPEMILHSHREDSRFTQLEASCDKLIRTL